MSKDFGKAIDSIGGQLQQALRIEMPNLMESGFSKRLMDSVNEAQRQKTSAWTCEKLLEQVEQFEKTLDSEHEVGAKLASFGNAIMIHLRSLKAIEPNLIVFDGVTENDEPAALMQHMHQLNVLLVAVKKKGPTPMRIGFVHVDELAAEASKK